MKHLIYDILNPYGGEFTSDNPKRANKIFQGTLFIGILYFVIALLMYFINVNVASGMLLIPFFVFSGLVIIGGLATCLYFLLFLLSMAINHGVMKWTRKSK